MRSQSQQRRCHIGGRLSQFFRHGPRRRTTHVLELTDRRRGSSAFAEGDTNSCCRPFARSGRGYRKHPSFGRLLGALISVALPAACADTRELYRTDNACEHRLEATVPVRMVNNAALVPAALDRTPVQMQIDTGAQGTMITPDAVRRLRLRSDDRHKTILQGAGGSAGATSNAAIRWIELGHSQWSDRSFSTGPLPTPFTENPMVAGLLGADLLSVFDVELDIPHGRMLLWSVQGCDGDFVPWKTAHYRVPLSQRGKNHLAASVEIDGHAFHALIDWGAAATKLKTEAAAKIGITPATITRDRTAKTKGVDGREIASHWHTVGEMHVGAELFQRPTILVGDLAFDSIDMVLGMDYFRTRHVWLSYATRQMFVEVLPSTPPAP